MLIDDLVAKKTASDCDLTPLLPQLQAAHKFVLHAEFAAVAEALGEDYSGLVRVFDRCRLPYGDTWIEFLQADRPRFMASGIQIPEIQQKPKRVGMLMTATRDDLSAWMTHLFWNFSFGDDCGVALGAMQVDLLRPISNSHSNLDDSVYKPILMKQEIKAHPGWLAANAAVRRVMVDHTALVVPGFPPPDYIMQMNPYVALETIRSDWAGELPFLLGAIGLLNARNAVETEPVDRQRINKSRKRDGKMPLFEHKILKIAGRQRARVYVNGQGGGDHAPMRAHMCRGHFKARKSGVFFWSPHVRGDLTRGRIEKEYAVK